MAQRQKSRVFVSYSRKDTVFAERLVQSLSGDKRDVWIDWKDIPKAAEWLNEIYAGIEAADTFIIIISLNSLTSEICNLELAHARKHQKRIVPIILQKMTEKRQATFLNHIQQQKWGRMAQVNFLKIRQLNWIFFDDDSQFEHQFNVLLKTVDTDLGHTKTHTWLLTRAVDWERNDRKSDFLLLGDEVAIAQRWLKDARFKPPKPTELHLSFIAASVKQDEQRRAEDEQRAQQIRRLTMATTAFVIVAIVAIIVVVIAVQNSIRANQQQQLASTQAFQSMSQANAADTQSAAAQSEFNRVQTEIARADVQSNQASTQIARLTVIAPGATRGARFNDWLIALDNDNRLSYWRDGFPPDIWTPVSEIIDGVEMVYVPAGCFMMGSDDGDTDEQPVHEVCIDDDFWMDRYEVSNRTYGTPACNDYSPTVDAAHVCVSQVDAAAHCAARAARLPSEAEWEYAARGPFNYRYPNGDTYDVTVIIGADNPWQGRNIIAPPGSYPDGQSWVGAYDLSGNVREWTATRYAEYPYNANDGRDNTAQVDRNTRIVMRGGAFNGNATDLRAANRTWEFATTTTDFTTGFRCVKDA